MTISTDETNYFIGTTYFGSSTIAIARSEIGTMLTSALGSTNFKVSTGSTLGRVINWRPNIGEEVFTSGISSVNSLVHPTAGHPGNYARFSQSYAAIVADPSNFFTRINTNNSNSATNNEIFTRNTVGLQTSDDPNSNCWVTANERSIATFNWNRETNHYLFTWCGVTLDNPSGFDTFPANCCSLIVGHDGETAIAAGVRAINANSSQGMNILTTGKAQYELVCVNGTEGPIKTADLWLIDDDSGSGNPGSGRCSNLLIAEGDVFAIGSLHSLTPQHPDPGSNLFLTVAEWGNKFILMRISG